MHIFRFIFSLHKWFGLISGVFLLFLGLSGSILVFKDELDPWLYKKSLLVVPKEKPISLDKIYHIITDKYPNLDGLAWANPSAPKNESYRFRLYLNDEKLWTYDLGTLNISQYTGEILRNSRSDSFAAGIIEWLFQFHFSFHLGMPGAALTAIFGITMIISIITGLIIYRKIIWKVLTFKVKIKTKNWRMLSSDLHRVIGVWSLFLNIIIFFTGFWMNLFAFEPKVWQKEKVNTQNNKLVTVSIDKMYAEGKQKMPELIPSYVYLPTQAGRKFSIRGQIKDQNPFFAGNNSIQFDPKTGRFISKSYWKDQTRAEKVEAMAFPTSCRQLWRYTY